MGGSGTTIAAIPPLSHLCVRCTPRSQKTQWHDTPAMNTAPPPLPSQSPSPPPNAHAKRAAADVAGGVADDTAHTRGAALFRRIAELRRHRRELRRGVDEPFAAPVQPVPALARAPSPLGGTDGAESVCGTWLVGMASAGHRYSVRRRADGAPVATPGLVSVTAYAASLFPGFDGASALRKMHPARRAARYGDMDDAAVLALWQRGGARAAAYGTAMHLFIEQSLTAERAYPGVLCGPELPVAPPAPPPDDTDTTPTADGVDADPVVDTAAFRAFAATLRARGLRPLTLEQRVYDHDLRIAGTYDALFEHTPSGATWLFDWKRRSTYTTDCPWGRTGLPDTPAAALPECHASSARLQLNIYRGILKRAGVCPVPSRLFIVSLHPALPPPGFAEHEVPVDDALFDAVVAHRKMTLCPAP